MTTSRQAKSFIDYSGWEADDPPTPGFANHANFLKNVENHVKEQAFHQRRRSRFEELYRQRQKLKQAHKESHEACQFPEIYVQNTQFLTVNTLDLNRTARRTKWLKDTKNNYRIHVVGARSMEVPSRRAYIRDSRKIQAKDKMDLVQKSQEKLCLEYSQGERIDDLATKQLSFYLQERRQQHLKAGKGIFQIPLSKP